MQTVNTPVPRPAGEIIARLEREYPEARCSLHFNNPLEALIAVMLSSQCRDERVNSVTAELFRKYRTAADYAAADPVELEAALKPLGLFKNKAKNLRTLARQLINRYDGEVPRTLEELTSLPGVGRKTALVVLQEAFGLRHGIAVDTHVGRLARRLGLTDAGDPVKVEADLKNLLPPAAWARINHLLIFHGRAVCKARRPKCEICVLQEFCRERAL
ncbi:MAG: endonuclease III [bacterium]|jgi:endonuclease-3